MVNSATKKLEKEFIEIVDFPKDDISWSSVSLSEVLERDNRLEASTFNIDRAHSIQLLENSKYDLVLLGTKEIGFKDCFYGPRAKRNYLTNIDSTSIGFLGSSEMLDIYPNPVKFVSHDNSMVDSLSLTEGTILISRSGTIGNVTFVGQTLSKFLVSEHAIRLVVNEFPGFVYTYLKTDVAQNLLHAEKFGSVILEIEPDALKNMLIPNAPALIKKKIHDLIMDSYANRDESNRLIDEATKIMIEELELPPIDDLKKEAFSYSKEINSFSTKLSDLDGRLEGSYHIPLIEVIEKYISKKAIVKKLNSEDLTEKIILPGRFKRIYVEKGNGKVFLGGKEINQLDPSSKKFLSIKHYSDKLIRNIAIEKNDVLVTRSGSVGRVMLAPEHWQNWISSDHVIRISSKKSYHGLIFTWLASEYGKELMKRQIYGSVVDEITDKQLGDVVIPVFKEDTINNSILSLINKANELRYHAYKQEQKAIEIMNREVLGL
ncbi:restriction endonuclease subunit S [Peptostreptococcus canis]|uniref:Restriction endonuclease subunit S n=1 Tax=Peptostreptococcus canis TaxID=1159213 RepID=A0ABR6TIK4_9FIRM|nr:restriction endonuclease subunit S [Peptostreptococcus canis]MBC2575242.1 restriction endonuclease subunit S [Peptostreptococcus canis]MBP1997577.1 type I restriction enzyme S subunit [Peptostreptococcus canis]